MSLFHELRRRNVFKVAAAYAIVAWLLVQVADVFFPALQLPAWTVTLVAALLILGFPVALLLSWAYELTPDGMKRTESVPLSESSTNITGRKLDFAIIGALLIAVAFLAVDHYVLEEGGQPDETLSGQVADRVVGETAESAAFSDAQTVSAMPPTDEAAPRDLRSIAALPFANESAAEENAEFFANGIHDELLTRLAKVGSLRVISRTSVEEYRGSPKNMRQIGQELGVETLLEGRVQRAGNRVRINVQLIDAETDEHLWAETYNRELTAENIFAIQGEMAMEIANALRAALSPEETELLNAVSTQSTRAYDFYLSGRDYFTRINDDEFMPLAVQQFERAVAEDPNFALAWAALARAHTVMYLYALDRTPARLDAARQAMDRALELAPEAGEIHLAMAYYHYLGERDYPAALAQLAIAEQAMPGNSQIFETRAYILRRGGEFDLAVTNMERAIQLDPRNIDVLFRQTGNYLSLRDYAQVERYVDRILEIAPDNMSALIRKAQLVLWRDGDFSQAKALAANGHLQTSEPLRLGWEAAIYERDYALALRYLDEWSLAVDSGQAAYVPKESYYGVTYRLAGRADLATAQFEAARTHLEDALRTMPDDARVHVSLGEALAGLGDSEDAARAARRATELLPTSADGMVGPVIRLDAIARVFAPMGDVDAVIEGLEAYLSQPGWWSIEGLLPDPRFDPVRDDPRFQALVERYRRR